MLAPDAVASNASAHWRSSLLISGVILAAIGVALWMGVRNEVDGPGVVPVPPTAGYLAAALLVMASGLISAGLVAQGRLRLATILEQPALAGSTGAPDGPRRGFRMPRWSKFAGALTIAGWPQVVVAMLLAALALIALNNAWDADSGLVSSPRTEQLFGGLLILCAFPMLVLERIYANTPPRSLPEAPQLERLSRVPLASCLSLGISRVLLSAGFAWATIIERVTAVVIALVALELVVRGLALLFVPFAPLVSRRSVADSAIAGLLRLTPPSPRSIGAAVKNQFGIDLSRSWALAFVRRSALSLVVFMVLFGWCLTGVTALGINERAVYERLGQPVAVFGPGLHLHLPWPLGIMRPIELGVVHEIPIILSPTGEASSRSSVASGALDDPEGPAPASADRLWDQRLPAEASYLIASESRGTQSFQIVNVDMRIVYRIGLSDTAARDAAYSVAEPDMLIRALAGRLLVRYFARYTLLDVLGQSRERFANEFREELRGRLRDLNTGIDVIAVIVEAIHPPAGAANAYHNVQAAEIVAQSQISLRRAGAIETLQTAEQSATTIRARAVAAAAERVDQAQAASVLFAGDQRAYDIGQQVFLFERWLDRLGASLPKSSFVLIDHRLTGAASPTIDLRNFAPPAAADSDEPEPATHQGGNPPNGAAPPQPSEPAPDAGPDDR